MQPKLPPFQPDATTWVSKTPDGAMQRVKVVDMTDQHLWRWIRYFRKKWRDERGAAGTDAEVDRAIQDAIITAPAIYAEAIKRHVPGVVAPAPPVVLVSTPASTTPAKSGVRRIDLNED